MSTLTIKVILLAIATAVALIIFFSYRSHFYLTYQHLADSIGLNLNNISTQEYVDWINTQPNRPQEAKTAIFLNKTLSVPILERSDNISSLINQSEISILGETSLDEGKWIETDLSEQRLYLKENGNTINSFLVSTGKWSPTPIGEWRIWTKLTSTRMVGGSKALGTYYNLPNVPYTMYYDRGYGIHGAYWHNNFGQTMSHGCTNMKPEEAKIVFDWASVGTRVIVHD